MPEASTLANVRVDACPGCGRSERTPEEHDVPDFNYGVEGHWSFVRCTNCRLVYLDPRLADSRAGYPAHYPAHIGAQAPRIPGSASFRERLHGAMLALDGYQFDCAESLAELLARAAVRFPALRQRARYGFLLFPRYSPRGRMLDVGCGDGGFLALMGRLGWEVHGIEPDEVSARLAREQAGATVHASLPAGDYPHECFDVITANHALEHVTEPIDTLREAYRICKRGGRLGIVVPNWRSLGHRAFGRFWYALDPPRHVVMYEPATLARLASDAGFTVTSLTTTSIRQAGVCFDLSWRLRTGRPGPATLRRLWMLASRSIPSLTRRPLGEEIVLWAVKD